MLNFFREAKAELEHVVWPTPNETKKYMYYNVVAIIIVTLFLMTLGFIVQNTLSTIRDQFPHDPLSLPASQELATQAELDALADSLRQSTDGTNTEDNIETPVVPVDEQ